MNFFEDQDVSTPKLGIYQSQIVHIFDQSKCYNLAYKNFTLIRGSPIYPLPTSEYVLLSSIHQIKFEKVGIYISIPYLNVGYYPVTESLNANADRIGILGSGIRGVFVPNQLPIPDMRKIMVKKSLYIDNLLVLGFVAKVHRQLDHFVNTGMGLIQARNAISLLLAEDICDEYMETLYSEWMQAKLGKFRIKEIWPEVSDNIINIPAPLTIVLCKAGYDSIISRVIQEYSIILPSYKK